MKVLVMESEVPGSIPTGSNILLMDFFCFHVVKALMKILVLLPILSNLRNSSVRVFKYEMTFMAVNHYFNVYVPRSHGFSFDAKNARVS